MSGSTEWFVVALCCGMISAATFALTADPLEPLNFFGVPFWLAAIVIIAAGVLNALVLVDLKRSFSSVLGSALFATLVYMVALWSPAMFMGHYSTHLVNYAMIQAVPVFILTAVLVALGVLTGTVINSTVREYDL